MAKEKSYVCTVHRTVSEYQTASFEVRAPNRRKAAEKALRMAEGDDFGQWDSTDTEVDPASVMCDHTEDVEEVDDA